MAILDAKSSKVTALGNTYLFGSTIKESVAKSALATFADGGDKYPMLSLTGYINPVQAGSGDPSPSNVRPITGWTGMNVYRAGKNLFSPTVSASTPRLYGATLAKGNEEVTLTETSATNYCCYGVYYYLLAGTYTFKFQATASDSYTPTVTIYKSNGGVVSQNIQPNSARTFTLSEDDTIEPRMFISTNGNGVVGRTVRFYEMQIETGSSASDWESYTGTTYPISWADEAGTVYGGTLDVTNGLLTVTHEYKTFNGTPAFYAHVSIANAFYRDGLFTDDYRNNSEADYAICDTYVQATYASITGMTNNHFAIGNASSTVNRFIIKDTRFSTVDAFNAELALHPINVVCRLATPVTYQLTPTEVLSVLGTNNVWVDTNGDVECTYIADTKMYIDAQIAAL